MKTETRVQDSLNNLINRIADEYPNLKAIMDQAKAGDITEAEAMNQMMAVVQTDPAIGKRLQEVAMEALAPLRDPMGERKVNTHGGAIMDRGRGLPRLNPLMEAALIERAQFDGDMPELRTGPLPPGMMPSVSVETGAKDPAMIGLMLGTASEMVHGEVQTAEFDRLLLVEKVAKGDTAALVAKVGKDLALADTQDDIDRILSGKHPITDAPSYKRGQVPAPIKVGQPTGSEMVLMTESERRTHAWAFLSTTQGRRSAVATIQDMVLGLLTKDGFEVVVRPASGQQVVLAAHSWVVSLDGAGSLQPSFNVIGTAAQSIRAGILREIGERRGKVILEVSSVNTVSDRRVGWAGRLLSGDPVLPAPG